MIKESRSWNETYELTKQDEKDHKNATNCKNCNNKFDGKTVIKTCHHRWDAKVVRGANNNLQPSNNQ